MEINDSKKRIAKDATVLTIAKVLTMVIGLVSVMLLSRFRSLTEYGTYSQILLVVNLAVSLFMLGLPNSINYFLSRCETNKERQHFLSVYYCLNTVLCLFMGAILSVTTPIIVMYFNNDMIRHFIYVLAILPWTTVIISSISNVLVVYGQTKKLTVFNVVSALVALTSVIIVEVFDWSFKVYMFVYLVGQIAVMLWVYWIVWKLEKKLFFSLDKSLIISIFKYSIPIGLASLVGTLSLEIDKLVVGKVFDTATLAIYTNSAKELPFTIIATSLTAVLLPQLVKLLKRDKTKEAVELWGKTVELSYIFLAFVVTALLVFAPQIMTILYSEKYITGVGVFRVYSLVLICRITYFGIMLNASGKTKLILYSSIITLIVNAVLDYVLYLGMGMIGPAVATFISIFVVQIIQLYATGKIVNVSFMKIFPWKSLLSHTIINALWGVPLYFVFSYLNFGVSMMEIIICIIIGVVISVIYGFIEKKKVIELWNSLNE